MMRARAASAREGDRPHADGTLRRIVLGQLILDWWEASVTSTARGGGGGGGFAYIVHRHRPVASTAIRLATSPRPSRDGWHRAIRPSR